MRSIYNIREQINSIRLHLIHSRRKNRIGQQIDPEKIAHLEKRIECKSRWYGNSYGGFYIIPGLLNESSIIYSIGIGKDISFDKACIKKHNCTVFAFDPTPKSIEWIRKQKVNGKFHFFDYGISPSQSGHHDFFLPANPRAVSGSILI
ncbi:MAG TPA: hypothetical protein PK711_12035 [Bacteroidales bacterium]|nr:hypothetical protein [Bacteroidales bacterium]